MTARSLATMELFLGPPDQLVADGERGPSRVRALWECGCEASGVRLTEMELEACGEHRADAELL